MQPCGSALRASVDGEFNPANSNPSNIGLSNHRPDFRSPITFKRNQSDGIHDEPAALCRLGQSWPRFGHDTPILSSRNPMGRVDIMCCHQRRDGRIQCWRRKQFAQLEQGCFLNDAVGGNTISFAPDHAACRIRRIGGVANQLEHRGVHCREMAACMTDHDGMIG